MTWTRPRSATGPSRPSVRGRRRQGRQAAELRSGTASTRPREYAAEDADVTLRLHAALWPQLESIPALAAPVRRDRAAAGARAAAHGAPRRAASTASMLRSAEPRDRARSCRSSARRRTRKPAHEFNLDSPKQLQQILFEKLQLPVMRKTPTGQPSTAEDVLEELAESYPLPRIDARVPRARETQIDLHRQAARADQRAHRPHAYQLSPGRGGHRPAVLSGSEPAEHSDPPRRRPPHPPGVHRAHRATCCWRPTTRRSSCASWRTCRAMTVCWRAFAEDRDVHQATAAEVFGVALDAVTADQRRTAKAINFGLIYGMSAFGLARQLGIERGAAQSYVERYFARYPGRAPLHGRDPRAGARARLRRDRVRPPPLPARHPLRATRSCSSTPSAARSTRRCRAPPRTSSSAP